VANFPSLIPWTSRGAVIAAALDFPASRFAAFSDCVILSSPADKPQDFLGVLRVLFENWFADGIRVRGGVAVGEIQWVDDQMDPKFRRLKNISFARVYGNALSEAVEIERSSGPGIHPFAADAVADRLRDIAPDSVLCLSSNVLRWYDWGKIDKWMAYWEIQLDREDSVQARRHIRATKRVLELFRKLKPEGRDGPDADSPDARLTSAT
jgi:hypothetical protein